MARQNAPTAGEADLRRHNGHRRLTLTESAFDELARGQGSPEVIDRLWAGQRSRRMIMLRAFYDATAGDPALLGPLPPVAGAWQALESAQDAASEDVTALLMHPQVGNWLAYALRRQRGGAQSPAPPWVDFGQFHTVALAAATIAGQPFTTVVPLRDGRVMLPGFGMAYFASCANSEVAEAGTSDGQIWIRHGDDLVQVPGPGEDADGWWSLRRLTAGEQPGLAVWLDDLDPMRDLADPVPPARLPEAEVRRWEQLLRDAWVILTRDHTDIAAALGAGVTSLVPLPAGDGWDTRSASTGDAFGAIMCSPPPDAETLAVSLAHEFMHIKLGGLMHLVPLTGSTGTASLYAPWRDDPRPPGGLLQGVYAFFGITLFWRKQRNGRPESILHDFEYAYARAQTVEALGIVRSAGGLTERGFGFTDGLAEELATWSSDEVDGDAAALARLVADGHRAGWRIRHCGPAPADVDTLLGAWAQGRADGVKIGPSIVSPDPEMRHWSQPRLGLARRRIVAPSRYRDVREMHWGAALTDADLALFAGDADTAAKGFAQQIVADPEAIDAWTGLGLALSIGSPGPAARALLARPEVVLAVHRRLFAGSGEKPSALDVADWVGRAVPV
ncbi:MAG: HEXXH motif domain-containing protein [Actinoplanes sp.]